MYISIIQCVVISVDEDFIHENPGVIAVAGESFGDQAWVFHHHTEVSGLKSIGGDAFPEDDIARGGDVGLDVVDLV